MQREIKLDDLIVEKPETTYYLRASGNSMAWAGIMDGDILIVDRAANAEEDSITVMAAGDDLTLAKGAEGYVWGVVTHILRAMENN